LSSIIFLKDWVISLDVDSMKIVSFVSFYLSWIVSFALVILFFERCIRYLSSIILSFDVYSMKIVSFVSFYLSWIDVYSMKIVSFVSFYLSWIVCIRKATMLSIGDMFFWIPIPRWHVFLNSYSMKIEVNYNQKK